MYEPRETVERVRQIPLEAVLERVGAERDGRDRAKWHTERGVLSVTGVRFMDWTVGRGGGGAIDLAMHLRGMDFKTAVRWLRERFGEAAPRGEEARREGGRELRLPAADAGQLSRVSRYLLCERGLPPSLLQPLFEGGTVYADARANAVFLLLGKEKRPVGAELRGTTSHRWRGMAPGSRKDLGYFSVGGRDGPFSPGAGVGVGATVVLCESAIDAISCLALDPDRVCISTSGARANPGWLTSLVECGHEVYCGFDADATGDEMAQGMTALHPTIRRLRPPAHDWNDLLTSRR